MSEQEKRTPGKSIKDRVFGSDEDHSDDAGTPVGRSDADADAARTGAAGAVGGAGSEQRDSEGGAVGSEDVEADMRRSGADGEGT